MHKKTILITGGAWYIGSHAVIAFEQAGYETVSIDNFTNSSPDVLLGIEEILGYAPRFYECDITNQKELEDIISKHTFDGVIHFAWLKSVGESCQEVAQYHTNNIGGSMILFGVMQSYGVRNIVFSSSATVYSSENISPISESMPLRTTNPYGTTKLVIEKLLEDYSIQKEWSVMNLRYFNPIWAHPSGIIGESPQWIPNNLLPYVLDVALWKRESVSVFGNDYPTPDGTGVRDYIDVNDLIDAHVISYKALSKGFHCYNVGTGSGFSVLELIKKVEQISRKRVHYIFSSRRIGDLASVFADVSKIKNELWWVARRTFTQSIESAWNFIGRRFE